MPKRNHVAPRPAPRPLPYVRYDETGLFHFENPIGYLRKAAEWIVTNQWKELRNGGRTLVEALQVAAEWKRGDDSERQVAAQEATKVLARAIKSRGRKGRLPAPPRLRPWNAEDLVTAGLRVAAAERQARKEGRPLKTRTIQLVREATRDEHWSWTRSLSSDALQDPAVKKRIERIDRMIKEMTLDQVTVWASFMPAYIEGHEEMFKKIQALRLAAAKGSRALRRALGFISERSERRRRAKPRRLKKTSAKSRRS